MATITKRNQRWLVQLRRKGMPILCRTFDTHADAKAWAAIEEGRLAQGGAALPMKLLRGTTLGDVLDRYLKEVTPAKRSADTERLRLEKVKRDPIAALTLAQLETSHLAQYRDRRLAAVMVGVPRQHPWHRFAVVI